MHTHAQHHCLTAAWMLLQAEWVEESRQNDRGASHANTFKGAFARAQAVLASSEQRAAHNGASMPTPTQLSSPPMWLLCSDTTRSFRWH